MITALTTGQVADYCHVTYWTVIKWIKSGKLKAHKSDGEHNRIAREDFVEFLCRYNLPVPPELVGDGTKRLLIVDDDIEVANLLKEVLAGIDGLEIETAINGYDAGHKITEFKPHVVILDLWMPNINGFEVCRHLKYNPETSGIKIIAITGYPSDETASKISGIGADFFLEKPLDTIKLRGIVENMFSGALIREKTGVSQ